MAFNLRIFEWSLDSADCVPEGGTGGGKTEKKKKKTPTGSLREAKADKHRLKCDRNVDVLTQPEADNRAVTPVENIRL